MGTSEKVGGGGSESSFRGIQLRYWKRGKWLGTNVVVRASLAVPATGKAEAEGPGTPFSFQCITRPCHEQTKPDLVVQACHPRDSGDRGRRFICLNFHWSVQTERLSKTLSQNINAKGAEAVSRVYLVCVLEPGFQTTVPYR